MRLDAFLEGIEILRKHYDDPDGFKLDAAHEIIALYPTDTPLSDEEFKRMRELNWFQDRTDDDADVYDPDGGWMAYT